MGKSARYIQVPSEWQLGRDRPLLPSPLRVTLSPGVQPLPQPRASERGRVTFVHTPKVGSGDPNCS